MKKDVFIKMMAANIKGNQVSLETGLELAFVAGYDEKSNELKAHNKKEIIQYNRKGEVIGTFDTIKEAAVLNGLRRNAVYQSLTGKTQYTRKHGHYFEYANNGKDRHH